MIPPVWIATPELRPDYRGPTDRPFTPFGDPAIAPPMLEILSAAAAVAPARIAIEDASGAITYEALLNSIWRLSEVVRMAQPQPGRIGILLPPSIAYVVAVFAVLADGRMSVLLDESYPPARNADLAARTGINLLIAASAPLAGIATLDPSPILHDRVPAARPCAPGLGLDEPAFILCTSGSAGQPKAIVHTQRTMLHWARTTHDALHVTEDDRSLSISPPGSLGGFTGLLSYPLAGAGLEMFDIRSGGARALLDRLRDRPITILRTTPSVLRSLTALPAFAQAAVRLRIVQMYGEPVTKADYDELRQLLPPACLIRTTYGSTEASGLSWYAGEPDDYDPIRVASGVLMPDTTVAILDDEDRSCPHGEAGELVIRSRYNALGEWLDGRPVPGRLAPDPSDPACRIFRTGDIARFHPDGVFVVLGRKDRMLKINGQRLEPAEIEAALIRSPSVLRAQVVLQQGATPMLVAFVVARGDPGPGLEAELHADLRRSLPNFMVPARVCVIPTLPLLPGGKVDIQALMATAAPPPAGSRR